MRIRLRIIGMLTMTMAAAAHAQDTEVECLRTEIANMKAGKRVRSSKECRGLNLYPTSSTSFLLEQDWFQAIGEKTDRNFTMGLGLARSGPSLHDNWDQTLLWYAERTVDWLSDHIVRPLPIIEPQESPLWALQLETVSVGRAFSSQLSGTAFTPKDLTLEKPPAGDRPYAFLLGWTTMRITADPQSDRAYTSELTVGMVGSRLGRNVQRYIHVILRNNGGNSPDPKGWETQIHDVPSVVVGMPTARYALTRSRRHVARGPWLGRAAGTGPYTFDAATDVTGELGYYTSVAKGVRVRLGYFSTPFWAWKQDPLNMGSRTLGSGNARCFPVLLFCLDGFVYGGVRGRATAYNMLLQGYPGHRGHRIPWLDQNHFGYEITTGGALTFWSSREQTCGLQVTYEALGHRSAEYKGEFKRPHSWGGAFLTWLW